MKYVYIIGSGHSGSTLLELLLSNSNRIFAMGEILHLGQVVDKKRLCSCGGRIADCPVWSSILEPLDKTHIELAGSIEFRRKRSKPENVNEFMELYPRFLERIRQVTACHVCTDSSKSLHRLVLLSHVQDLDLRVLYLTRHVGGVLASQMRKGRRSRQYVISWIVRNLTTLRYLKKSGLSWRHVQYEKLTEHPEDEMKEILRFLSEPFDQNGWDDFSRTRHLVEGNRIRLRHADLTIRPPSDWAGSFSALETLMYRAANSIIVTYASKLTGIHSESGLKP